VVKGYVGGKMKNEKIFKFPEDCKRAEIMKILLLLMEKPATINRRFCYH